MPLDPSIPVWPRKLAPVSPGHALTRPILVGPQPLSGQPQSVISDMGAWKVTLSDIPVHDDGDRVRLFRALLFGTLSKGLPVYVPFYDWRRSPRARTGLDVFPPGIPFSDLATFSDTSTYAGVAQDVVFARDAAARDDTIVVTAITDAVPTAGEFLGIGDRVHHVSAAFPDDSVSGQWTLNIEPPLRFAAIAGDLIETADPLCRMILDRRQAETMLSLNLAIVGRVSLDFTEANWTSNA